MQVFAFIFYVAVKEQHLKDERYSKETVGNRQRTGYLGGEMQNTGNLISKMCVRRTSATLVAVNNASSFTIRGHKGVARTSAETEPE